MKNMATITKTDNIYKSDVVIVGGGLAGIVTAFELLDQNRSVVIIDRDKEQNFGGLAKKSFGGIMFVDTPHQRKMGIKDSPELALSDWNSFAQFNSDDLWPQKWAKCYVERSIDLIFDWLSRRSVSFLPLVNWPERGVFHPGNSIPRWHIAWGTGYGIIESILKDLYNHPNRNKLTVCFEHKVSRLLIKESRSGADHAGTDHEGTDLARKEKSGKSPFGKNQSGRDGYLATKKIVTGCAGINERTGEPFEAHGDQVVLASGGICGGDLSMVRDNWYREWGEAPETLLNGSHRFADGMLHKAAAETGAKVTHLDKQWHYAAGIFHPHPEQDMDGLSLVPPRSALWMDAQGRRFGPVPLMGYTDTRYVVEQICKTQAKYSWLVLNWKIAIKELAISGCDYMTAFRHRQKFKLVKNILLGDKDLVRRLIKESKDIVVADSIENMAEKMESLSMGVSIDSQGMASDIRAYDDQIDRGRRYFNDDQLRRIANFRDNRGDRMRMCRFQKIDDHSARPLIAIRTFILSRKSLGGVMTNLQSQVLDSDQSPISGLYAVGETAGFGGGGIHGRGSLEGTFLGCCVLTARAAALSIAGKSLY
ncbi:MAG: FAD-binding protein [Desulfamplus sp.]|nr:FAD-binding protein [Desulfamplus sp.]